MQSPALVFDLDGTLVDTAPDLLGALNLVLSEEGRPSVALADLRHLVGHGAKAMLTEAMRRTGAPAREEDLPRLVDAFVAYYRQHIADASKPFPGVPETLDLLERAGARMAILTNKPQVLTDLLMPAVGLASYFRAIHGAGRLEVVKPDARVFHHVIDELGGDGAGTVMVGDSATDVATARAAGVPVILMTYGYCSEPHDALGADAMSNDFREVPELVRKLLG